MRKAVHQNQMLIPFVFAEIEKPKSENYWQKYFGFVPKVGAFARIDEVVAFCEAIGDNAYCYCMRVKILEINGDIARVETTKEWQEACGGAGGTNAAGNIWQVSVNNLAPIFDKNKKSA